MNFAMTKMVLLGFVLLVSTQGFANGVAQTISIDPLSDYKARACSELPFSKIHSIQFPHLNVAYVEANLLEEAKSILKSAELATTELNEFFGITYKSPYTIYLLKTRESLDNFLGQKTQDYVVGFAYTNFDNIILSESEWTAKSKANVKTPSLVKHEMIHSYIYQMVDPDSTNPCLYGITNEINVHWLDEGFATYVSGQLGDWKHRVKTGNETPATILQSLVKGNYATSATVVELLFQEKGKDFVVNLIKLINQPTDSTAPQLSRNEKIVKALGGHEAYLVFNDTWKNHLRKNYPEVKN